jgi:hypothetical protein
MKAKRWIIVNSGENCFAKWNKRSSIDSSMNPLEARVVTL